MSQKIQAYIQITFSVLELIRAHTCISTHWAPYVKEKNNRYLHPPTNSEGYNFGVVCPHFLSVQNHISVLSDFINLTQVHNFTVSAQDSFTFRRLSVFTVSFTGILQIFMQIMKCFVASYWLVKWLWYRVYNEKVVSSSPRVCVFFIYIRFV